MDRAIAGLLTDLKRKGMFEDTLIVWGGEFGRTPMAQRNKGAVGRDHHMKGFNLWLAGGGIKGGVTHGTTIRLATTPRKTAPTSTTSTPRFCICSASITKS